MKAGALGLIVSAVAFAGSTLYLWQQLQEQRAVGAEVAAANEALKARVAELERHSGVWDRLARAEVPGPAGGSEKPGGAVTTPTPPSLDPNVQTTERQFPMIQREPSPAMQRMMRNQMRANHKRIYGDFVAQIGLSREEANEFYDLLTNQWTSPGMFGDLDPEQHRLKAEEHQRRTQAKLNELLGSQNLQAYEEYQQSLGARSEVDMLSRQLEGVDLVLSADQRKKLVGVLVEEQKRVAQPDYSNYGDPELYQKAMSDWQADYNERMSQRARGILDSDQTEAFDQYQQWQKELREQFASAQGGRMLAPGAPMRGTVTYSGNSVAIPGSIATSTPVVVSETVITNAPPSDTARKP